MNALLRVVRMLSFITFCNLYSLWLFIHLAINKLRSPLKKQHSHPSFQTTKPQVEFMDHPPKNNSSPKDTLLFCHGFPDYPGIWDDTVDALTGQGYHCVVAAFPGSRGEKLHSNPSFDEILKQVTDKVRELGGVTIVGFDWGSFVVNCVINSSPELFKRAIFVDVGKFTMQSMPGAMCCTVAYQITFALCYMVGGDVGSKVMRQVLLSAFNYSMRPMKELTTDMAHWYRICFPLLVTIDFQERFARNNLGTIPTLFVYGKKKLFMFHDAKWEQVVRQSPHGRVVEFNSDHWIMCWKGDEWKDVCIEWLEETKEYASKRE